MLSQKEIKDGKWIEAAVGAFTVFSLIYLTAAAKELGHELLSIKVSQGLSGTGWQFSAFAHLDTFHWFVVLTGLVRTSLGLMGLALKDKVGLAFLVAGIGLTEGLLCITTSFLF